MNWQRWPWLEEVALPLAVFGIGVTWLWPWLLVLSRWLLPPELRPILPLWSIVLLLAGGAILSRLLTVDPEKPWRTQSIAIVAGLLAIFLTLWWRLSSVDYALWDYRWLVAHGQAMTHWNGEIPASILVAVVTAYLWLRGMKDSDAPNHDDVLRAFGIGFAAIVVLLIIGRIDPAGLAPNTIRWIILFFAIAMAALAMAGLRMARSTRNPTASLPVNRYWAVSITILIVVLLSIGLLLSLLVTPDAIARITGLLNVVTDLILQIFMWLLYALVYVVFLVLTPLIHWIEERIGRQMEIDTVRLADMQRNAMEINEKQAPIMLPSAVEESMRWLLLLGGLVVVALTFAGALRLLRKQKEDDEDEIRETVLSQELLRDQASSLWARWRDRLRRGAESVYSPYFPLDGVDAHRRRIRVAYQAFLSSMSTRGFSRRRRQTPHNYARYLGDNGVANQEDLQTLTDSYISARYGDAAPSTHDVAAAEEALAAIERTAPNQDAP